MNPAETIPYLACFLALVAAWWIWRLLGPSVSHQSVHRDTTDAADDFHNPSSSPTGQEPEAESDDEASMDDYHAVGWFHVSDARKLLRRLDEQGLDFFVEAPHMDPAAGEFAPRGSSGANAKVMLHVHHDDLAAFDTIQQSLHRQETEPAEGSSVLEAFRKFALDHDLDVTHEEREERERS